MKITKEELKGIIKEELDTVMTEDPTLDHVTMENVVMVLKNLSPVLVPSFLAAIAAEPLGNAIERVKKALGNSKSKHTPLGKKEEM